MVSLRRHARNWLLVIATGVALGGAGPAERHPQTADSSQQQTRADTSKPQAVSQRTPTTRPNANPSREAVASEETPNYSEKREQERDGRSEADLHAQRALVGLTFVQVVIGGFGLWMIWGTLQATRDAVREANDATKAAQAALDVAEMNADFARQAVEVSKETANHQLRAYVVVDSVMAAPDGGGYITAKVRIRNRGATPAYKIAVKVNGWVTRFPSSPVRDAGAPKQEDTISPEALSPDDSFEVFPGGKVEPEEMADIRAGHLAFYAFGTIAYEDFNGESRLTNFCYRGTDTSLLEKGDMRIGIEGNSVT